MVSDSDMGSDKEESETEERESEGMESGGMEASEETGSSGQEMGAESAAPSVSKPKAKGGGRRAALRILRENVDSVSKDLASFRKNHEVTSKRLDKQVSSLRNEVASLKSFISKENARARGKQEAILTRVIAKLNEKKPKAAGGAKSKKKATPKKSKGKK
jgi:hypothetical protein